MIRHQMISVQAARLAYQRMKQKGRRLPWSMAENRLSELEANPQSIGRSGTVLHDYEFAALRVNL
jgi:hypothetical protein